MICRIRKSSFIPQARESEGKPGNAGLRTGIVLKSTASILLATFFRLEG